MKSRNKICISFKDKFLHNKLRSSVNRRGNDRLLFLFSSFSMMTHRILLFVDAYDLCIYTSLHLISNKLAHRLRSWNNIWWDSNSDNNILLIFILSLIVTDMTLRMEPTYAVNKTFDLWVEIFRDKNFPKLL